LKLPARRRKASAGGFDLAAGLAAARVAPETAVGDVVVAGVTGAGVLAVTPAAEPQAATTVAAVSTIATSSAAVPAALRLVLVVRSDRPVSASWPELARRRSAANGGAVEGDTHAVRPARGAGVALRAPG